MMKHFKEYLRETSGKVTITFGQFNPPSAETEKLIKRVHETAQGGPYRIYTSQVCNEQTALDYNSKIKCLPGLIKPEIVNSNIKQKNI